MMNERDNDIIVINARVISSRANMAITNSVSSSIPNRVDKGSIKRIRVSDPRGSIKPIVSKVRSEKSIPCNPRGNCTRLKVVRRVFGGFDGERKMIRAGKSEFSIKRGRGGKIGC